MSNKQEISNAGKRQHIANLIKLGFNGETQKLYLLEGQQHRNAMAYCYCTIDETVYTKKADAIRTKVLALFAGKLDGLKINSDPRGYALKIDDGIVRKNKIEIMCDFGGYGILAYKF